MIIYRYTLYSTTPTVSTPPNRLICARLIELKVIVYKLADKCKSQVLKQPQLMDKQQQQQLIHKQQ
jgi:hypothetical protein